MFAEVDLTALTSFLNSIVPALGSFDPVVAGVGAILLFIVQQIGGKKFDLWGTVKWALAKFAPKKGEAVVPEVPEADPLDTRDLQKHEKTVLAKILEAIRNVRIAQEKPVEIKAAELFEALKK